MLEDEVDKQLRVVQGKQISKSTMSVSYSKVVNDILKKGLK